MAVSDAIVDEFTGILRDKFQWSAERLNALRAEIATFTKHVTPTEKLDAVPRDRDDNSILECAVAARSEVIVSGDLDLLSLGNFRGIEIMTVSAFLQREHVLRKSVHTIRRGEPETAARIVSFQAGQRFCTLYGVPTLPALQ